MNGISLLRQPGLNRWLLVGLVLLFVALGVRYSFKVIDNRSAITRWQPQIRQLDSADISKEFNYPNPPIMAILLEPLAHLPPVVAAMIWFFLKAGLALLSLYWVFQLVETSELPFPPWARILTILLSLKPIVDDLNHGNVNLFIGFLVVAALTAYRHKRDALAGLVLGLAIACKVTPALFVPYFLWKREWRVLAGIALGLVLFLYPGLVPAVRLGWEDNFQQLVSWYEGMVKPFVIEGRVTSEHINQSLPGVVFRLLTDSPSFVTWVNDVETPARFDNVLSLPIDQAKWLIKGCMGLFALLVVLTCRTPTVTRHGWRLAAELSIVMLGMLLFSERTWKHHAVTLILPFAVLCYCLAQSAPRTWMRRGLASALVVSAVLMFVTGLGGGKEREEMAANPGLAKLALVYGAYLWAWLILLAGLGALLCSRRASSAGANIPGVETAVRAA